MSSNPGAADFSVDDLISSTMRNAPELASSPGAISSIANSAMYNGLDPNQSAQAIAHAQNMAALTNHKDQITAKTKSGGWWGSVLRTVYRVGHNANKATGNVAGDVIGEGLKVANMGLQEVQHQYRYLHDIEARHGPWQAFTHALPLIAGGALGGTLGGGSGAILGAELAGGIEGRIVDPDAFERTANGENYRGHFNRQSNSYFGPKGEVSVGRDTTQLIGFGRNPLISGVVDAAFDLGADPLVHGLGIAKGVVEAKFALTKGAQSAEQLAQQFATNGSAKRAVEFIAQNDGLAISRKFEGLTPIAAELEKASTPKAVQDILYGYAAEADLRDPTLIFPHIGPKAAVGQALRDKSGTLLDNKVVHNLSTYTASSMDYVNKIKLGKGRLALGDARNAAEYEDLLRYTLPYQKITITHDLATGEQLAEPLVLHANDLAHKAALEVFHAGGDEGAARAIVQKQLMNLTMDVKGIGETEAKRIVGHAMDVTTQGMSGGSRGLFGHDFDAADLSQSALAAQLGDDTTRAQAIWDHQLGHMVVPDFIQFRRDLGKATKLKSVVGSIDDFAAKHVTKQFRLLALMSGATGVRIALSEAVPEMLRSPVSYIQSVASAGLAKSTVRKTNRLSGAIADAIAELPKDSADEVVTSAIDHVMRTENLWHKGGDLTDAIRKVVAHDPVKMEVAMNLAASRHGAGIANDIVGVGHLFDDEMAKNSTNMFQSLFERLSEQQLKDIGYSTFGDAGPKYIDAWHEGINAIAKSRSGNTAARAWAEELKANPSGIVDMDKALENVTKRIADDMYSRPVEDLSRFTRTADVLEDGKIGFSKDKIPELANAQARAMRGLVFAPKESGQVLAHQEILDQLVKGKTVTKPMLESVDEALRPQVVSGRNLIKIPAGNPLETISNFTWSHVIDPIIGSISRDPMYLNRMTEEVKALRKAGINMADDDIMRLASERATKKMIPFIHNPDQRSIFGNMARNFMPFYYAQEQAYKRFFRLAGEDPAAFRRLQLAAQGLTEMGHHEKDGTGASHFVFPGTGFLNQATGNIMQSLGIPMAGSVSVGIGGQLKSLESVIPASEGLSPSFGPFVTVPSHLMEMFMPETSPIIHGVIGDQAASGSLLSQMFPNSTVKRLAQAFGSEHSRSFQSSMVYTIQAMAYADDQNPKVQAWRDAHLAYLQGTRANDVKIEDYPGIVPPADAGAQARQTFIDRIKTQTRNNYFIKALVGTISPLAPTLEIGNNELRDEYKALVNKKGIAEGSLEFITKHPDATAYTVSASKSNTGAYIPATQVAQEFLDSHGKLIKNYPYGAAWLVPQQGDDTFSSAAYNEQLAQHFRIKLTPNEFLNNFYVAKGNREFYDISRPQYVKQRDALKAAGNTYELKLLNASWSNYLNTYGQQNPVWMDDFTSSERKQNRELAINQLNAIFAKGEEPKNEQSTDIRTLLADYENYKQRSLFANAQYGAQGKDQLSQVWESYLDKLQKDKKNLAPIIGKLFAPET